MFINSTFKIHCGSWKNLVHVSGKRKKKKRFIQEMPELKVRHEKCGIIPLLSLLKEMCSEHALVAPLTNELLNIL